MQRILLSDLDGTLISYMGAAHPSSPARANPAMMDLLGLLPVIICTNQGGLALGAAGLKRKDGRPYPTPADFLARLNVARQHFNVVGVYAAIYQPLAESLVDVTKALWEANVIPLVEAHWKKPSPDMLLHVSYVNMPDLAGIYYGDSQEDEQAALAAGMNFVHVKRYEIAP